LWWGPRAAGIFLSNFSAWDQLFWGGESQLSHQERHRQQARQNGGAKATKASKIFFNNRCFKKACKVGTSCEAYEAWDSSSSDED
jgi:hypothetical protein